MGVSKTGTFYDVPRMPAAIEDWKTARSQPFHPYRTTCILILRTQLAKLNNFATRYCICRVCPTQQEALGNKQHLLNSMCQIPSVQNVHKLYTDLQKLLILEKSIKKNPVYYSGALKGKKSFGTAFNSACFLAVKDHLKAGTSNKRHANHTQALQENSP